MTLKAFFASTDATVKIAATNVSSAPVAINRFGNAVRVVNLGPANARIQFGMASGPTTIATANSMLVLAGTVEVFTIGTSDNVAAITDAGAAALEFNAGEGF